MSQLTSCSYTVSFRSRYNLNNLKHIYNIYNNNTNPWFMQSKLLYQDNLILCFDVKKKKLIQVINCKKKKNLNFTVEIPLRSRICLFFHSFFKHVISVSVAVNEMTYLTFLLKCIFIAKQVAEPLNVWVKVPPFNLFKFETLLDIFPAF